MPHLIDTTTIQIPNVRLTEGQVYDFLLLKVFLQGDDDEQFVLKDPLGYKMMMPAKYYRNYGFVPGQLIKCRVDKINCNGRMFLEPLHPHYMEGEVYAFDVVATETRMGVLGSDEHVIWVRDVLGYQWEVVSESLRSPAEASAQVNCLLQRIKKGRLYLKLQGETDGVTGLTKGEWYYFIIADETTQTGDGMSYYILEDETGRRYLLRKKYYLHYGYSRGNRIKCRMLGRIAGHGILLEPEHPCYQPGKSYDFDLKRMETLVFSDNSRQKVLVFSDCFGEDVKVHVDDETAAKSAGQKHHRALVKDIYKSRLELELII